jgi:hypothetical protein
MKQLFDFRPLFDPTNKILDFTNLDGFTLKKLYGVINVTKNTPIYLPGVAAYGITGQTTDKILNLTFDTSSHSSTDIINVYYETNTGFQSNTPMEYGGHLQRMSDTMAQMLIELRLMNIMLQEGLNIRRDDLQSMRDELTNNMSLDSIKEI